MSGRVAIFPLMLTHWRLISWEETVEAAGSGEIALARRERQSMCSGPPSGRNKDRHSRDGRRRAGTDGREARGKRIQTRLLFGHRRGRGGGRRRLIIVDRRGDRRDRGQRRGGGEKGGTVGLVIEGRVGEHGEEGVGFEEEAWVHKLVRMVVGR